MATYVLDDNMQAVKYNRQDSRRVVYNGRVVWPQHQFKFAQKNMLVGNGESLRFNFTGESGNIILKISDSTIAEAYILTNTELMITGKKVGTVTISAMDNTGFVVDTATINVTETIKLWLVESNVTLSAYPGVTATGTDVNSYDDTSTITYSTTLSDDAKYMYIDIVDIKPDASADTSFGFMDMLFISPFAPKKRIIIDREKYVAKKSSSLILHVSYGYNLPTGKYFEIWSGYEDIVSITDIP